MSPPWPRNYSHLHLREAAAVRGRQMLHRQAPRDALGSAGGIQSSSRPTTRAPANEASAAAVTVNAPTAMSMLAAARRAHPATLAPAASSAAAPLPALGAQDGLQPSSLSNVSVGPSSSRSSGGSRGGFTTPQSVHSTRSSSTTTVEAANVASGEPSYCAAVAERSGYVTRTASGGSVGAADDVEPHDDGDVSGINAVATPAGTVAAPSSPAGYDPSLGLAPPSLASWSSRRMAILARSSSAVASRAAARESGLQQSPLNMPQAPRPRSLASPVVMQRNKAGIQLARNIEELKRMQPAVVTTHLPSVNSSTPQSSFRGDHRFSHFDLKAASRGPPLARTSSFSSYENVPQPQQQQQMGSDDGSGPATAAAARASQP